MKIRRKNKNQKGFTLLEYCAGAAVIAGVVYSGLSVMGGQMEGFFVGLGQWIGDRTPASTSTDGEG